MIATYINLAFDSLRHQKLRTFLTMLAISVGIAAVIMIMSAGQGLQRLILGQLDIYGADTFNVEVRVPQKGGFGSAGIAVTTMKEKDVVSMRKLPNIAVAYGFLTGQEVVSYGSEIKRVMLFGQGAGVPEVEKITFTGGRFFTQEEEDSLAQVAVLGSKVRDQLFGDEGAVGKTIYIKGKPFRVVGTLGSRGAAFFLDLDSIIILPVKTMQKKLLGIDYYSAISGKFKDVRKSSSTVQDVQEVLRANHSITDPKKDDFEVQTVDKAISTVGTIANGIVILLVALIGISLVVGGVGIMNIMYVSVAERTFEIGLRKSLGARRRDILWQFLSEAVIVTIGGGVVGIAIGALLGFLVYVIALKFGLKWVYSVPPSSIALSVGFSAAIGVIFGLYPAKKAAALHPIDAIRKE